MRERRMKDISGCEIERLSPSHTLQRNLIKFDNLREYLWKVLYLDAHEIDQVLQILSFKY